MNKKNPAMSRILSQLLVYGILKLKNKTPRGVLTTTVLYF
jgi:hypothetical protein